MAIRREENLLKVCNVATVYLCAHFNSQNKQGLRPLNSLNRIIYVTNLTCLQQGRKWIFKYSFIHFVVLLKIGL